MIPVRHLGGRLTALILAASASVLAGFGDARAQDPGAPVDASPAVAANRPVGQLWIGESLGNRNTYVTLDRTTDLVDGSFPGNPTHEFRESTNQHDYAVDWRLQIASATGGQATPVSTSFHPAYQETLYRLDAGQITKAFFVPFETEYTRAGQFLLRRSAPTACD